MPAAVQDTRLLRKQKVSLRLSSNLVKLTQEAIELGLAVSASDFIEEAVRLRTREVRNARLRRLAREAMEDPGFVADMRETSAAFRDADSVPAE